MRDEIDTGDTVLHKPSGETWVVAAVEGEHLYWCGWPPGRAHLADCELLEKAKEGEALRLLHQLAEMHCSDGDGWDARKSIAIARLAAIKNGAPAPWYESQPAERPAGEARRA